MRHILSAVIVAALIASPLQAKSLYWKSIDVNARLDREGILHISERQKMVFDGDWNGGERRFNVGIGQKLQLERLLRLSDAGPAIPLQSGNLDAVDHYQWSGNTLRWRSRLPSDAPFENKILTYELDYTLDNVLVPQKAGYLLDHEFAFAARDGVIEHFTLELQLDSPFRPLIATPLRWTVNNLAPGQTFGVRLPLAYDSGSQPANVQRGASAGARAAVALLIVGLPLFLISMFLRREKSRGRFEPLPESSAVDEAWLTENLFSMPAEVAGAAWDNTTGAPEVAGLLARLVQEGKLSSRVEKKNGFLKRDVLHLKLLAAREQFRDYEKNLVNALFFSGRTEVTTDEVREHYKSSGFDPSSKIRGGIDKRIGKLLPPVTKNKEKIILPIILIFVAAAVLIAIGCVIDPANLVAIGFLTAICVALFVASLVVSFIYARGVTALPAILGVMLGPQILFAALMLALAAGVFEVGTPLTLWSFFRFYHPSMIFLAGMAMLSAGFMAIVLANARTRDSAERLAVRRRLAAARQYFLEQLHRSAPALRDEWYPYLIAFGLGANVDHWFRSFGTTVPTTSGISQPFGTSSSVGGSSSGTSWTGGGGGFGGAGASGAWAAAAGTLAAGYAAPSSGGGGGGGGGGGFSSGGGGGGGW